MFSITNDLFLSILCANLLLFPSRCIIASRFLCFFKYYCAMNHKGSDFVNVNVLLSQFVDTSSENNM